METSAGTETEAVALARRLYAALAAGDTDLLGDLLAPDFTGRLAEGMPAGVGGTHEGPQQMWRDGWGGIGRAFAARAEPDRFLAVDGGRLLVTGRYRGAGRRGGGPLDAEFAHLITVVDGRITALDQYTDTALWRDAQPPYRTLRVGVSDGVARIQLDRPAQHNALNDVMGDDLRRATALLASDPAVRAVLLSGAGGTFSAGGDIGLFHETPDDALPARLGGMVDALAAAVETLAGLDAPVVAAVQGAAAGAGLALVCVADLVVAAEDAVFTIGYGGIGLTADGGLSWTLPRLVGARRARELFLTGRRLTAAEAQDWGLVTRVVPADEVPAEAERLAARVAAGPTSAFGAVRRLLRDSYDTPLHAQLRAEQEAVVAAGGSADLREGVTAFLERRRPAFIGR
ncbi:enoyl-CoA hydratase-related protein [Pseudonocardia sp. WMMC193]|uniref:enoyl-CoA hydratase-related protein n=1 Tax=Pseudonocardia sp. WMMC193 TaxID=2911965 RepID=UPI001F00F9F2|nr:enoyl-CoA hydratase-related protein [Pseudonocardia sp. WMMC193]MCF7548584.1 enoyl-CoA hydratase-related protein [Pseudonocardia sp. WMMC193]